MTSTGAVNTHPASVSPRRRPLRALRRRRDASAIVDIASIVQASAGSAADDGLEVGLDSVEDLLRVTGLEPLELGVEIGDDRGDAVVGGNADRVVGSREEGGEIRVVGGPLLGGGLYRRHRAERLRERQLLLRAGQVLDELERGLLV